MIWLRLVRKTAEERRIWEEVPIICGDHSGFLHIRKGVDFFVSTALFFFLFFPPAIDLSVWCLWNNWSNPLRLTGGERAAGSFSSSPDREMVGSYLRNFWFSFHPMTAAVFVTGLHGHPKLHRGSADAVNLERIQPKRAPAIVAISKAYSTMQISHQMSHVTVSCCFHRKLWKISEILHK